MVPILLICVCGGDRLRTVEGPGRGYISCVLTAATTWLVIVLGPRQNQLQDQGVDGRCDFKATPVHTPVFVNCVAGFSLSMDCYAILCQILSVCKYSSSGK